MSSATTKRAHQMTKPNTTTVPASPVATPVAAPVATLPTFTLPPLDASYESRNGIQGAYETALDCTWALVSVLATVKGAPVPAPVPASHRKASHAASKAVCATFARLTLPKVGDDVATLTLRASILAWSERALDLRDLYDAFGARAKDGATKTAPVATADF